jgi:hypothetical protein
MKEVDFIVCAGQSNEAGGATGTPSAIYSGFSKSYIFHNGIFQSYKFGVNNNHRPDQLNQVCRQTSLSFKFAELTNKPLFITKYAYGGSCLVDDGTPYVNGLWQIDANPLNVNSLPHFSIMMNDYVIPSIIWAQSKNIKLKLKAFCWTQGEGDAITEFRANNYEQELQRLFDEFLEILTPYNVIDVNFKFVVSRIHNNFNVGTRPFTEVVRTAQSNIIDTYDGVLINTDSYALAPDNVHWNNAGQEVHGIDTAIILSNL